MVSMRALVVASIMVLCSTSGKRTALPQSNHRTLCESPVAGVCANRRVYLTGMIVEIEAQNRATFDARDMAMWLLMGQPEPERVADGRTVTE